MSKRVLFLCTYNSIRSPMAEGLLKDFATKSALDITSFSAGIQNWAVDPFSIVVMKENGISLEWHDGMLIDDLDFKDFDVVITLSPTAQTYVADDVAAHSHIELQHWDVEAPRTQEQNRDQNLAHFALLRDHLNQRIVDAFGPK